MLDYILNTATMILRWGERHRMISLIVTNFLLLVFCTLPFWGVWNNVMPQKFGLPHLSFGEALQTLFLALLVSRFPVINLADKTADTET